MVTKNKNVIRGIFVTVFGVILAAGSIISTKSVGNLFSMVAQGNVDWGHYTALKPTGENPGSKEFWVSCSDHSVQFEAPNEYRSILERGAPTLEMVQAWGDQDSRYLAAFDSHFSYLSESTNVLAWGENDGTHVFNCAGANGFGISAATVNALMAQGYTQVAFDWSVDWDAWGEKDVKDEIVFFNGGWVERYFTSVGTSGTESFTLAADTQISAYLQRNPSAMYNQEYVISNVRLLDPTSLEGKMYTSNAWTSTGALSYNFPCVAADTEDTWSLYFKTTYADELYEAGYRTMTVTFTVTKTPTDYLTTAVNGAVTSYKNGEAVYTLSFLLSDLKAAQLQVRTNSVDVTDGNHNDGCTGNRITISNITLSNEEDASVLRAQARARLSKVFYSSSNCWRYIRHNDGEYATRSSWGANCVSAVFGSAENGQTNIQFSNTFLQDMKTAGYTKVTFHVKGVSTDNEKVIADIALTTSGTHSWNYIYQEYTNVDEATFTLDLSTKLADIAANDILVLAMRTAQPAVAAVPSIITLSNIAFSVDEAEVNDASIKEFYTTKQVRRVEQQDAWKSPIGDATNEVGHKEFWRLFNRDTIHLSAHYASDDPKFTYNSNWSEWRFQHTTTGLTSVTFTYLYEDSNSDLGNDGVSDVHTMCQWYGAAYQGRTMNLVADGAWHTITVTGDAYDTNFFVMKIYHFTGDIYISNIVYA